MDLDGFFRHHGLRPDARPFDNSDDAKQDTVFGELRGVYRHPDWRKFFGDPAQPATAVVFGRRGAGKTALRLQMKKELAEYNRAAEADGRRPVMAVEYVEFNAFQAAFRRRLGPVASDFRGFDRWLLPDHLDALLSLAATHLVTSLLERADAEIKPLRQLERARRRDLLRLALLYDNPPPGPGRRERWLALGRRIGFFSAIGAPWRRWESFFGRYGNFFAGLDKFFGVLAAAGLLYSAFLMRGAAAWPWLAAAALPACLLCCVPGWRKGRAVRRKAGEMASAVWILPDSESRRADRRACLREFRGSDFAALAVPPETGKAVRESRDFDAGGPVSGRFELMEILIDLLHRTGCAGLVVVVDEVDEPELIGGDIDPMWAFVRSLFDNKLLQFPGLGIKLLLPDECLRKLDKEDRAFKNKARPDKQNLVRSLEWSGAALIGLADRRLEACALDGANPPRIQSLFAPEVAMRLQTEFESLRCPRRLFRLLDRAIKLHLSRHTDAAPEWLISDVTFELAKVECEGLERIARD